MSETTKRTGMPTEAEAEALRAVLQGAWEAALRDGYEPLSVAVRAWLGRVAALPPERRRDALIRELADFLAECDAVLGGPVAPG